MTICIRYQAMMLCWVETQLADGVPVSSPAELRREDLEEEIALIDDAGDVDGGETVRLVDIDVVLLVGEEAGAARGDRIRPEVRARWRAGPEVAAGSGSNARSATRSR